MPHDRTLDHFGVEPADTAVLSAPIGRYPPYMTVQAVLVDLDARLTYIEGVGCDIRVFSFTADAYILKINSLTADAYIHQGQVGSFTANASLHATVGSSFTANAYLIDRTVGGATTLAAPVSSGASIVTVTDPSGFPNSNGFAITIAGTNYTVTGGAGTTTWTISPVAVTSYSSGTTVNEVC